MSKLSRMDVIGDLLTQVATLKYRVPSMRILHFGLQRYLDKKPEFTAQELAGHYNMIGGSVPTDIAHMCKQGVIKEVRILKNSKGGRPSRVYALTSYGIEQASELFKAL